MPLYDGVRWGTSLLGRHFALAGSVALHVVVGAVAGGHAMAGGETAEGANAPLLVEIESLVTPATPLNGKGPDDPREAHELARAHPHPTHKHDYPVPAGHDEWPHDPSIVHMASAETSEVVEEPSAESSLPQPAVETPVRFVLARSTAVTGHEGLAVGHGTAGASAVEEATAESRVSFPARIAATVPVIYPPEARAAEVEADIALDIVVERDGSVVDARPSSHEGYGLEAAAVRAMRGYRFTPAQQNGQPVRVRMRWTVQFRLR